MDLFEDVLWSCQAFYAVPVLEDVQLLLFLLIIDDDLFLEIIFLPWRIDQSPLTE